MVEGYLLTELPLAEVARRCSLPPATVVAFESLFFDCREHLAASGWILTQAVGAGPWNNFAGGRLDVLWKYVGFAAGHRALEVVIAVTADRPLPDWVRTSCSKNPAYGESRLRLLGKLTLAAMTAPSDAELGPLVGARERLSRLDRRAGVTRDEDPYLPALGQFLQALGKPRPPAPGNRTPTRSMPKTRGHNSGVGKKSGLRKRVAEVLGPGR